MKDYIYHHLNALGVREMSLEERINSLGGHVVDALGTLHVATANAELSQESKDLLLQLIQESEYKIEQIKATLENT